MTSAPGLCVAAVGEAGVTSGLVEVLEVCETSMLVSEARSILSHTMTAALQRAIQGMSCLVGFQDSIEVPVLRMEKTPCC